MLRNTGRGLAKVKEYCVVLDGDENCQVWKGDFFEALAARFYIPGNVVSLINNQREFFTVPADASVLLYGYETDANVPQPVADNLNNRLRFKFHYCSIYGDEGDKDECWLFDK